MSVLIVLLLLLLLILLLIFIFKSSQSSSHKNEEEDASHIIFADRFVSVSLPSRFRIADDKTSSTGMYLLVFTNFIIFVISKISSTLKL